MYVLVDVNNRFLFKEISSQQHFSSNCRKSFLGHRGDTFYIGGAKPDPITVENQGVISLSETHSERSPWQSPIHGGTRLNINSKWIFDCNLTATDPPNLPQCIAGAEPGLILHPRLAAADVFNFILFHAKFGFVIYNFTTWWLVVGHKDKDYTRIKVLMTLWGMLIVVTWWSYGETRLASQLWFTTDQK